MVIPCWYLPRLLSNPASRNSPRCSQATFVPREGQGGSVWGASGPEGRSKLVQEPPLDPFEGAVDVSIRQRSIDGTQHQAHRERLLSLADLRPAVEVHERNRLDQGFTGSPDRVLDRPVGRVFIDDEGQIAHRSGVPGRRRHLRWRDALEQRGNIQLGDERLRGQLPKGRYTWVQLAPDQRGPPGGAPALRASRM